MPEQNGTASTMMSSILKNIPIEWILPVVFDKVLASIKNPKSQMAMNLKKVLVPFAKSIASKYPEEFTE